LVPFLINSNLVLPFLFSRNTILTKISPAKDLSLFFLSYLNLLRVLLRTALLRISLKIISSTCINLRTSFYWVYSSRCSRPHNYVFEWTKSYCFMSPWSFCCIRYFWSFYYPSSPILLVWFWWHSLLFLGLLLIYHLEALSFLSTLFPLLSLSFVKVFHKDQSLVLS